MFQFLRGLNRLDGTLVRLNPWLADVADAYRALRPGETVHLPPQVEAARKAAMRERLECGASAWNRWADAMGAIRPAPDDWRFGPWSLAATVDLAALAAQDGSLSIAGLRFPGDVLGQGVGLSTLDMAAAHIAGRTDLSGIIVRGATDAQGAGFAGGLILQDAAFHDRAEFRGMSSARIVSIARCRFHSDAWFSGADLAGGIDARDAQFHSDAGFGAVRFGGPADFTGAAFFDNAGFEQAVFADAALFRDAAFGGGAWFRGATMAGESCFERTRFAGRADFDGASAAASGSPVRKQIEDLERSLRRASAG